MTNIIFWSFLRICWPFPPLENRQFLCKFLTELRAAFTIELRISSSHHVCYHFLSLNLNAPIRRLKLRRDPGILSYSVSCQQLLREEHENSCPKESKWTIMKIPRRMLTMKRVRFFKGCILLCFVLSLNLEKTIDRAPIFA